MTSVRETVDLRAEHEEYTMMSKCINAVHAGTYDNPACRSCACSFRATGGIERAPKPFICRRCGEERAEAYKGLCDGCRREPVPRRSVQQTPAMVSAADVDEYWLEHPELTHDQARRQVLRLRRSGF